MTPKIFTIAQLAELTDSKPIGNIKHIITDIADLESAEASDASFLNKLPFGQTSRYEQLMRKSLAGVIFVHPDTELFEGRNYLLNEDPSRAFQKTLEAFKGEQCLTGFEGIHPTAVIHPTAKIGKTVSIGPYVVIDKNCTIGDRTHIGAATAIGPDVTIGADCILHPRVTLREGTFLGQRVIIQPGAVIGSCGFGYTTNKQGLHQKLNQVGNVVIEDDVEIGANSTIDRSRFKSTLISRGTKIDNLVQIGHGAKIGQDNLIVALSGVAGSSETGRHVVMGGQSGLTGHLKLADGVILTARTGVDKSLPHSGKYGGVPGIPLSEHNRILVHIRNLASYVDRIKKLEAKLESK